LRESINIYCDESCHLLNDKEKAMAIGAVYCPASKKKEVFKRIADIKKEHKLIPSHINENENRGIYEIKWNKVSKSKIAFFKDIIDYFFDDDDLSFRVLVVPDKSKLNHDFFKQDHNTFYYKMYFSMLKTILNPEYSHNIYIDIKDTQSREKVHKLEQILRTDKYDYSKEIIKKVQQVKSHEVELLQLTDLLIGAISYVHRGLDTSLVKNDLIQYIRNRSKYSLLKSTLIKEKKMNIFIWESKTTE
jgi:hypothetical protein